MNKTRRNSERRSRKGGLFGLVNRKNNSCFWFIFAVATNEHVVEVLLENWEGTWI